MARGAKETKAVQLDEISDGDLAAVIVHDAEAPGGFRVAGYCDGAAIPSTVERAKAGSSMRAPCVCGGVDLVYRGYSHAMPDVHPWPTLTYFCTSCGKTLSYMRLTAEDARRAMSGGFGTSDEQP